MIVTMDKERHIYEKGSIAIKNGKIKEVGELGPEKNAEEVIDANGKIIMPGLISSYTRMHGILLRAMPLKIDPPTDLSQILQRVWWRMDEEMTKNDDYTSALASCLEFIKTGTTCCLNTYSGVRSMGGSLDRIARAVDEAGLRASIGFEASDRNTRAEGARGMDENIKFIKKLQRKRRTKRIRGVISLHASFTISDELLSHTRRLVKRYDVPLVISTAEGAVDTYYNLASYGMRTVERLHDKHILSPKTVLVNCVHVSDDELHLIQESGAKVVHNPMKNMLNGVGVAKVSQMLSMGIPTGLGNGGYIFDGFENMRSAYLLHKAVTEDPRTITPMETLEMATIHGAKICNWENEIGSIEPGKYADLIVIDTSSFPTPLKCENVVDHIVNTVNGQDIETVIVGGRILMRERKVITLQEDDVIKASNKSAKKLWKKLEAI
ncbi:hypothetical protein AKJ45_02415 [candidate division MSBL1 archaeon SCGC-AAA261F19]|uniref:Amidohydrolase-related domain-containing protein n=2 Tax=candidate division MSBL1 TaxID=215777 RepID=A0A133V9N3_9EURY|nr:hypothetical protein AKJ43_01315 [candidate division MSBL1 archaeon SCGC-AAA261D19]KXB03144.1 hypothetical protein AKJ45_02415 [candidate division MSBL1 archaeon SCGC-AAA261F19]